MGCLFKCLYHTIRYECHTTRTANPASSSGIPSLHIITNTIQCGCCGKRKTFYISRNSQIPMQKFLIDTRDVMGMLMGVRFGLNLNSFALHPCPRIPCEAIPTKQQTHKDLSHLIELNNVKKRSMWVFVLPATAVSLPTLYAGAFEMLLSVYKFVCNSPYLNLY